MFQHILAAVEGAICLTNDQHAALRIVHVIDRARGNCVVCLASMPMLLVRGQ